MYFVRKGLRQLRRTSRNALDALSFRLDTTRFIIDKPKFEYQPISWLGIESAKIRGESTKLRWSAIDEASMGDMKTMKDIGCCAGYFCHKTAEKREAFVIGIDANAQFIRVAQYVRDRAGLNDREVFMEMRIDSETVGTLPRTDVTLLLSVWHHWVFEFGLNIATLMLQSVWDSTSNQLFFESGEEEVEHEFGLPYHGTKASEWLMNYLESTLRGSNISVIGSFSAGAYEHYKLKSVQRSLFLIERK